MEVLDSVPARKVMIASPAMFIRWWLAFSRRVSVGRIATPLARATSSAMTDCVQPVSGVHAKWNGAPPGCSSQKRAGGVGDLVWSPMCACAIRTVAAPVWCSSVPIVDPVSVAVSIALADAVCPAFLEEQASVVWPRLPQAGHLSFANWQSLGLCPPFAHRKQRPCLERPRMYSQAAACACDVGPLPCPSVPLFCPLLPWRCE